MPKKEERLKNDTTKTTTAKGVKKNGSSTETPKKPKKQKIPKTPKPKLTKEEKKKLGKEIYDNFLEQDKLTPHYVKVHSKLARNIRLALPSVNRASYQALGRLTMILVAIQNEILSSLEKFQKGNAKKRIVENHIRLVLKKIPYLNHLGFDLNPSIVIHPMKKNKRAVKIEGSE